MYMGCGCSRTGLGDASSDSSGASDASMWVGIGTAVAKLFSSGSSAPSWTPATCNPALVNAHYGPKGPGDWWYDNTDGHELTHAEATQRCNQLALKPPAAAAMGGLTVGNIALLAGIAVTGFLLIRTIGKRS